MIETTRRRLSVEERKEEILLAALKVYGRKSPESVSIEDVAAEAGASRPLVYRYFKGREELHVAALRKAADELNWRLHEPLEGPPSERLARSVERYLDFIERHGSAFVALLRAGFCEDSTQVVAIVRGVREKAAAEVALHLGVSEPGPLLDMTLRCWVSVTETAALGWLKRGEPSRALLQEWLVRQALSMLTVVGGFPSDDDAAAVRRLLALEDGFEDAPGQYGLTGDAAPFPKSMTGVNARG